MSEDKNKNVQTEELTEEELTELAQRLKTNYPETQFYTSHCTGDHVSAILTTVMDNQLHSFSCGCTKELSVPAHIAH